MGVLPLLHIFHVQHKADYLEEFLDAEDRERGREMHSDRNDATTAENNVVQTAIWFPGAEPKNQRRTGPHMAPAASSAHATRIQENIRRGGQRRTCTSSGAGM